MLKTITSADFETFATLCREFYSSAAVLHPIPESYYARTFDELMKKDSCLEGYLLLSKDKVAGYALVGKGYSPEVGGAMAWVEEIYLRPSFRGNGLGKAFFDFLFARSEFARIRLEVEKSNDRAAELYHKLGFSPLDYVQMVRDRNQSE